MAPTSHERSRSEQQPTSDQQCASHWCDHAQEAGCAKGKRIQAPTEQHHSRCEGGRRKLRHPGGVDCLQQADDNQCERVHELIPGRGIDECKRLGRERGTKRMSGECSGHNRQCSQQGACGNEPLRGCGQGGGQALPDR